MTDEDGSDREKFTFEEFAANFDWSKVNPVGPIFDLKKPEWLNGLYLRDLELGDFTSRLLPFLERDGVLGQPVAGELGRLKDVAAQIQTRIAKLTEASALVAPFFVADEELVVAEDAWAQLKDDAPAVLDAAITALEALDPGAGVLPPTGSQWDAATIEATLRAALVDGLGLKPKFAFGPLRTAVSGQRISPPLFESMEILGKGSTLARLRSLRASI